MPNDLLTRAIAGARHRFGASAAASGNREPDDAEVGTGNSFVGQTTSAPVPSGPTVPSAGGHTREPDDESDMLAAFEERAAIMEYDGGLDRDEAERLARIDLGFT